MTRRPAAGEAPVHITSERYHYVLDANGGYTRTFTRRYRIETLAGVESWAETGAAWSPWYQARPKLSATVTSTDGGIARLDPKTIAEQPAHPDAPDIYSDARVLRAPLPAIAVGSIVEEVVVTRTTRPFFEGGSGHAVLFQSAIPRDRVELTIDVPPDASFRYEIRDAKLSVKDGRHGKFRRLVLSGGPYPAIEPVEPFVPSDVAAWPHVQFTTAKSWRELARAYGKIVDKKLSDSGLDATARGLVRPEDPPRVKANKLLDWVRNRVRYAGIEFGEASIVPRQPHETLRRGYGDCKDQSLLLVALLRAVGVRATVALLRAGNGEDVLESLPALTGFDHLIVVVPGEQGFWIDPTSPYARAGELPQSDQGRLALVIDDDSERLTRTPETSARDNTYLEERVIRLSDLGSGRVVEVSNPGGGIEQIVRSGFDRPQNEMRQELTKYIANEYAASELARAEYPSATELGKPFRVELEAANVAKANTATFDAYAVIERNVLFGWLPDALFDDSQPRRTALRLPLPYRAELRYRVVPPQGFSPAPLPASQSLSLGPAKLEHRFEANKDGSVSVKLSLDVSKRRWTAAEVSAFRAAIKRLERQQRLGVGFDHRGQKLIEERRTREGLALFRSFATSHSNRAIHRSRLALALLEAGFGEPARSEALRAVEIEPNSPLAYRSLALVLRSDTFGRALQPGFDRDGALAAFQKAAEIDPDDVGSRLDAAVMLEHDAQGKRYRNKRDLELAIGTYDAIDPDALAQFDDGAFRNNPLFALAYAGRYRELEARIAKLSAADTPATLAIIATTAQKGPVSGIAQADRLGLRGDARSEALSSAGETLAMLRRYSEASALISAAAPGSSKSVQLSQRARLLAKVKAIDIASLKSDTPAKLVTKALVTYATVSEVGAAVERELFSSRALSVEQKQPVAWLRAFGNPFHKNLQLSREMSADTLVAMTEAQVSGDERGGFRVKTTLSGPGVATQRFDVFVVREAGGLRIRAIDQALDELGAEALHRLAANETNHAKRWLGWATEQIGSPSGGRDPLAFSPFLELWKDGKGNPELAAAALCAHSLCAKLAKTTLEPALSKATTDHDRSVIEYVLFTAFTELKESQAALDKARALERRHPSSAIANKLVLIALAKSKRYQEYRDKIKALLARGPRDDETLLRNWLAGVHTQLGRFADAKAAYQVVIDKGQADAGLYNNRAWLALFTDAVREEDVGFALQAAQLQGFGDVTSMHTLASLYAEAGKPEEAWQTFLKLLELRPRRQPETVDWYVVGRVAEAYGLVESARAAYRRVPAEGDSPTATHRLAQKRLNALAKPSQPAAGLAESSPPAAAAANAR